MLSKKLPLFAIAGITACRGVYSLCEGRQEDSKLKAAIIVFRHGSRTPVWKVAENCFVALDFDYDRKLLFHISESRIYELLLKNIQSGITPEWFDLSLYKSETLDCKIFGSNFRYFWKNFLAYFQRVFVEAPQLIRFELYIIVHKSIYIVNPMINNCTAILVVVK